MESTKSLALLSLHEGVLRSMAELLSRAPGIQVISATGDSARLIEDIRLLAPDVALIDDFKLPSLPSLCEQIRQLFGQTKLAILRSPVSFVPHPLPSGLEYLDLMKPIRVRDLAREIEAFAGHG
jgi:hypothetical protein